MFLVHVSPHLPPDQAANALLPSLAGEWSRARGHEVHYVGHPPAQGGSAQTPAAGSVEWVPRREGVPPLSRLLRIDAIQRTRHIRATLDRVAAKADLLHLHSNGLLVEAAAQWATSRGIPYVLTLYGTEIWHYKKRWPLDLFARAYRGAAAVTFYSKGLMARAIELGLNRPNLSAIYPAVPLSFDVRDEATRAAWRDALGIREPRLILNVKRLHELAGQTYLLDAFALVRPLVKNAQDVRLVICGTGALRSALEAQAASLGISNAVTFAGLVSNDEVARYTAVADVFALPSLLEALPTVAVEALASGTPVVSADHPGGVELHDIFGDDVAVVPKRDARALAHALTEALDSGRRTRVSTHDALTRLFRPDAIASQYEALYQRVQAVRRASL